MEGFIKNALENYEAPYNPNDWLEMEKKLDASQAIPGNEGSLSRIMKSPATKVVGGIALVASTAFFIINIFSNQELKNQKPDSNQSTSEYSNSIFDFIRNKTKSTVKEQNPVEVSDENAIAAPETGEAIPKIETNQTEAKIDGEFSDEEIQAIQNEMIANTEGPMIDMVRRDSKDVKEMPPPNATYSSNVTTGCVPLTVKFNSDSKDIGLKYLWNFGDGYYSTDENPTHTYNENGNYQVSLMVTSAINGKSITYSDENMISVFPLPEVKFDWDQDEAAISGNEVQFADNSVGVVDWNWLFGDRESSQNQNPQHTYAGDGSYKVVLVGKSANGCVDTASGFIVIIGKKRLNVWVPNGISPNSNVEDNRYFKPVISGLGNMDFEMKIYTRSFKLIFETNDIHEGWDGRMRGDGNMAPQGTYIYQIILIDEYGIQQDPYLGNVTLIR